MQNLPEAPLLTKEPHTQPRLCAERIEDYLEHLIAPLVCSMCGASGFGRPPASSGHSGRRHSSGCRKGKSMSTRTHRAGGFTLVELLVVIAIIGLLAVLLFPLSAGKTFQRNPVP